MIPVERSYRMSVALAGECFNASLSCFPTEKKTYGVEMTNDWVEIEELIKFDSKRNLSRNGCCSVSWMANFSHV